MTKICEKCEKEFRTKFEAFGYGIIFGTGFSALIFAIVIILI